MLNVVMLNIVAQFEGLVLIVQYFKALGFVLSMAANIRPGWKLLTVTNELAYNDPVLMKTVSREY